MLCLQTPRFLEWLWDIEESGDRKMGRRKLTVAEVAAYRKMALAARELEAARAEADAARHKKAVCLSLAPDEDPGAIAGGGAKGQAHEV